MSSYEIASSNDTINLIDCKGLKQGHWIISKLTVTNNVRTRYTNTPTDTTTRMVKYSTEMIKTEEGFFIDNKKEGLWKFFNTDGTIKESVEYQNDIPVKK